MPQRIILAPSRFFAVQRARRYFRSQFARAGAKAPRIRVCYSKAGNPPHDVLIERRGDEMTLVIEDVGRRRVTLSMQRMLCAYAYWLSLCPPQVKHITVNTSDGDAVSNARFAASVRFPHHIGVPDPHYFQNHGFASELAHGKSAPQWADRSDDIVWRGGMNGTGWLNFSPQDKDNPAVLQRLRMVMRLKDAPGTDVRFSEMRPSALHYRPFAVTQGILGDPVPASAWLGKKFAIDIDGYSNTWSNLLVRMLYGCCVLKVDSQLGFRQWYYDGIRPYEHYVPVSADMSDFAEKIEWVRSHALEARAIARRGQIFAQTLTFETQARRAVEIIEEHWDRDALSYASGDAYAASVTIAAK